MCIRLFVHIIVFVVGDLYQHISCVQAKGQFKRRSTANNVEILIPVPADADTPQFKVFTRAPHIVITSEPHKVAP